LIGQFAAALGFLTRLPSGRRGIVGAEDVARSARWFPLVGALLGGIYVGIGLLLIRVFPPFVTAVIIVAMDALLTGALHLDGLADTADGFGGGHTREDVLRIMRDHSIGAYGAIALILVIALKIGAIVALIEAGRQGPALFLAPVLGRWAAVFLGASQTYARPIEHDSQHSVGTPARFMGRTELIIATVIGLALAAAAGGWTGVGCFAGALLVSLSWSWRCRRRIGGVTGDTIGAGVELSECLVLLLLTALR